MHTLLFILAYIAFAYGAPPKVTFLASAALLLAAFSIQTFSPAVAGIQPSFTEAVKAIGLSFFFLLLLLLFFASATQNPLALVLLAINPLLVPVTLFMAFALGFSLSLNTTLGASAQIAGLTSIFVALLVIATRRFILS